MRPAEPRGGYPTLTNSCLTTRKARHCRVGWVERAISPLPRGQRRLCSSTAYLGRACGLRVPDHPALSLPNSGPGKEAGPLVPPKQEQATEAVGRSTELSALPNVPAQLGNRGAAEARGSAGSEHTWGKGWRRGELRGPADCKKYLVGLSPHTFRSLAARGQPMGGRRSTRMLCQTSPSAPAD
jgi:hypothetical protein